MTLSMYQASVPVAVRALTNLSAVLKKGHAHAQSKQVEDATLLQTRLVPDMLPLVRQGRRSGRSAGVFALTLAIAFVLPLSAGALYLLVGTPAALKRVAASCSRSRIWGPETALNFPPPRMRRAGRPGPAPPGRRSHPTIRRR